MSIQYNFTIEEDLLIVTSSGFDENLEEVEQYEIAIVKAWMESKCSHVLCNELDLEYRLGILDTFKAAEYLAENKIRLGKTAIVCNEKFINNAKFWETVAVNRGLSVRVFKDVEAARSWLSKS